MTYIRHSARLAALATAVALTISCDTRIPTASCTTVGCGSGTLGIGSDITAPVVKLALATGSTSADTIVYIGGNLGLTFTATDSFGVATISTTLRGPAGSSIVDSATFNPTLLSVTRPYAIDVATIAKGDRLVFTTRARDASFNSKTDSLRITVADTATPVVTVASKIAPIVKGLDSVTVAVLATDAAGIDSAGFMLLRVRGPGDTVVVFSHGSKPAVRSTSYALDLGFRISDTLPVGQYLLMPFAADKSGLSARNPTAFSFQLADATRPLVTILAPTASGHVAIGDSILVKAHLTDNSGVSRVTFTGLSGRGNPALGTQDTVVRYATITAPSSGSFVATRDTTVTRYLKVVSPVDTLADTLIVRAIVTDASNNSTQLDVKVAMVPTLSISSTSLGATIKNGDAISVRVVAGDTAAVYSAGYRVYRVNATDSTLVRSDSVSAPTGTTTFRPAAFNYVVPDTLSPAVYALVAFARTSLGLVTRQATGYGFTVTDGQRPTVTLTAPLTGSTLHAGDSILVTTVLKDNVALQRVTFRGFSVRGRAPLGTADTVVRYTTLTAPTTGAFRAGLRDTTIQRYLKIITPIDTVSDSLVVLAVVSDLSGLADTTRAALKVTNTLRPRIVLNAPVVGSTINVGDSILVKATLHDDNALASVAFFGTSARGNPDLGTADTVTRYPRVATTFRAGLRDTTILRYLKVATPIDTLTDSLIVTGVVANALNIGDTSRVKIKVVNGPTITIITPIPGDSASAGVNLRVRLSATQASGVVRLGFRIVGDPNWPTALNDSSVKTFSPAAKPGTIDTVFTIPANAPTRSFVTISPFAVSGDGQLTSSTPLSIPVRSGASAPAPRVVQSIGARSETTDSVTISASGNGITTIGYELRVASNAIVKVDTVKFTAPLSSSQIWTFGLNLSDSLRGRRLALRSFAIDQAGLVGYSVSATTLTPQTSREAAFVDTALVVYGTTYPLPSNRNGTIADLQVDAKRGNIFLSNINFGRLEVWTKGTSAFDSTGVIVGSQPWGMTFSRTAPAKDTMYVANSGGTNLSRVYVGGTPATMKEDLINRLVTRASYLFKVTEAKDPSTGKIRLTTSPPILFSDRPQYVEQSVSGRLYFSTKPTLQAPQGTIRYMSPADSAPDERFILDFAFLGSDPNSYVIANLDDIGVVPAPATSALNDLLTLCDHSSGTREVPKCVSSREGIVATIAMLKDTVPLTDVDYRVNIDFTSLGLTDTTYAAASGDGRWITFGEGNKGPVARNFALLDDGSGWLKPNGTRDLTKYTYASPSLNILDLMTNASDQIFGVALDKTGKTIGVHGTETAFADVTYPFTQRLQGKRSTFSKGAGIAFHPNADGRNSPADSRLAFVASDNGTIEAVDIAYYDFVRGSLATKFNLYGPLRASLPFPGDPANVVFKLFGVSAKGLVVVDVTATDLLPPP